MFRSHSFSGLIAIIVPVFALLTSSIQAVEISGHYMEARTCQVYTGPCFANGEVGLAGKEAVMAWNIVEGDHKGIDLAGLKVVVVVRAGDTLGFRGIAEAGKVRSLILVDEAANSQQQEALIDFAKTHSGKAGDSVARVKSIPIKMPITSTN